MGGGNPSPSTGSCLGPLSLAPNAISGSLFVALTGSRGSSWHIWPMSRLTHLVQGRSYNQSRPQHQQRYAKREALCQAPIQWRALPGRKSYAIIGVASRLISPHISAKLKSGKCSVALGSGSPSAGSRYMLFMVGVSAHDSEGPGTTSWFGCCSFDFLTVIHFSPFLRARACDGGGGGRGRGGGSARRSGVLVVLRGDRTLSIGFFH